MLSPKKESMHCLTHGSLSSVTLITQNRNMIEIQGSSLTRVFYVVGNGTGGESIYGGVFPGKVLFPVTY